VGPQKAKIRLVLILCPLLVLLSCGGLATKNHPPLVFALNLSAQPVSLALAKGTESLVTIDSLGPLASRALTKVEVTDGVILRQGTPGTPPVKEWADPAGAAYSLRFEAGELYAIVVDPRGQAALYSVPETYSSDPKLCIVNATATTLSQVQAAATWAKNVKVYTQDVAPVVPSEFLSFEPKTLGLYWQTLDQVSEGAYTPAQGFDGHPLKFSFEAGRYYLFLAGNGAVRDITPTLD
jgi:hypothetical protein